MIEFIKQELDKRSVFVDEAKLKLEAEEEAQEREKERVRLRLNNQATTTNLSNCRAERPKNGARFAESHS